VKQKKTIEHAVPGMTTPMIRKCGCQHSDESMRRFQDMQARTPLATEYSDATSDSYIVLQIRYVILPLIAEGNISETQVQANHEVINTYFKEVVGADDIPNTTRYPYKDIMGAPKILFEPLHAGGVTEAAGYILRLQTPTNPPSSYDEISQMQAELEAQGHQIEPGVIYVYITSLQSDSSGSVLGVAEAIISNACAVSYGTVGSATVPGTITGYEQGKTLVHELGHCLGLFHPFSHSACDSSTTDFIFSQNPQGVRQKNPNVYTTLAGIDNTNNGLDNRGRDSLRYCTGSATCEADTSNGLKPGDEELGQAPYSCPDDGKTVPETLASAESRFETFMIFMDYGDDTTMLAFPSFQCDTMRSVIENHKELFNYVKVGSVTVTPVFPSPSPQEAASAFPTWAIILISVLGGLLVLGLLGYFLWRNKARKAVIIGSGKKSSYAYHMVSNPIVYV
jgi:hypothetical protein